MTISNHHANLENSPAFQKVKAEMQRLYNNTLTERKAAETARNLIGFTQLYLEVKQQNRVQ
jgi:hypothetical protein